MVATAYDVIRLLQKYTTCYTNYPVHTFSKVILCGDTGAGKSSLAKVKWIGPGFLGYHKSDNNAYNRGSLGAVCSGSMLQSRCKSEIVGWIWLCIFTEMGLFSSLCTLSKGSCDTSSSP